MRSTRCPNYSAGCVALIVALLSSGSAGADGAEANSVEACMRANAPSKTAVEEFEIGTFDESGEIRTVGGKLWWRRFDDGLSKLSAKVEKPPDMRGTAFLLIEQPGHNDMFTYLPELRKTRRITSRTLSGSLFGSEFSYEDFEHLQSVGEASSRTRLPDEEVAGRKVYVVVSEPSADSGSAYERIVSRIDQETCVPIEVDFFGDAAKPVKELRVDPQSLIRAGGVWVPQRATLRNLRNERESRLVIHKVEFDVDLPRALFSQSRLGRL